MKTLVTLITAFMAFGASAQCTVNIFPAPAYIKITTDQTINATGQPYWVCEGVTLNISSSVGTSYMLEQNATINIYDSDGDNVYAKNGCTINNYSTQDISYIADPATVTANNLGTGTLTLALTCTPVVYDYSMVGGSPCVGVTSDNTIDQNTNQFNVYPNPLQVGDFLNVVQTNQPAQSIMLFDATGKLVIEQTNGLVSTTGLQPGMYYLKVNFEQQVYTTPVVLVQ
jgi:hypothetical protein